MKQLLFTESWWKNIKLLTLEDRKEVIYAIVAMEMEGEQPSLLTESAATVLSGIAKELLRRMQRRRSRQICNGMSTVDNIEKEQNKETNVPSSALHPIKKENKKEKDLPSAPAVKRFDEALAREYPNISRMPEPLSFVEFQKLVKRFPLEKLKKVATSLDHYEHIDRYKSAYKTIIKWLQRE